MQFAFTYLPWMQTIFGTAPVGLFDGLLSVGVGVALLLLVEIEKRIMDRVLTARAMSKAEPEPASIPRW
jgi:Cation transporting ATPase, C-terminus